MGGFVERLNRAIHKERYERPHFYNIAVGLARIPLYPSGRLPVISFLVQADLNNTGVINVGDGGVSLVNGVQLDPGRAWVFGTSADGLLTGSLYNTPGRGFEGSHGGYQEQKQVHLFLDLIDFFCIADTPAQNMRVFWTTATE